MVHYILYYYIVTLYHNIRTSCQFTPAACNCNAILCFINVTTSALTFNARYSAIDTYNVYILFIFLIFSEDELYSKGIKECHVQTLPIIHRYLIIILEVQSNLGLRSVLIYYDFLCSVISKQFDDKNILVCEKCFKRCINIIHETAVVLTPKFIHHSCLTPIMMFFFFFDIFRFRFEG